MTKERRRARFLLLAPLLAAAMAAPLPAEPPGAPADGPVLSEHYRLFSDGPRAEAQDLSRALEAAWPQLVAFFGASPHLEEGQRLDVRLFETQDTWRAGITKAGGTPPADGAGGYYDPGSRTAFAWRQPTVWYTRTLLLHEAVHQFHFLARTKNKGPAAGWYTEGIAEHLSHHTWDGRTLRMGIVPLLSLEDRAGKALEDVGSPVFRLEPILEGKATPRPASMHLVRYLAGDAKRLSKFEDLARKLDQGSAAGAPLFAREFGPPKPFLKAWREWLPTVQEPWGPVHNEWEALGPTSVRGRATVVSACRTRKPAERVSARFVPSGEGWSAGVLLHHGSTTDFTVGLVDAGLSCRVDRFTDEVWTKFAAKPPRPAGTDGGWTVCAFRRDGKVVFTVNAAEIGAYDLPLGSLGLAVDHSVIDFTDLAWE